MTTVTRTCADCGQPIHWYAAVNNPGWLHDDPRDMRGVTLHAARPGDAPYPLDDAAGPGRDGDPDPAGETIPCPGCRSAATLHPDGSVTCHGDGGTMTPTQAQIAAAASAAVDHIATGGSTVRQELEEMRGWTP